MISTCPVEDVIRPRTSEELGGRHGEDGIVTSTPTGTYRVQFQLGEQWLLTRAFCTLRGSSEFRDPIEFAEIKDWRFGA
jgi:hypothetical protein